MKHHGLQLVLVGMLFVSVGAFLAVALPYKPLEVRADELEGYLPAGLEAQVSIKDFQFQPATLSITVGTKVTWVNNDTQSHTATSTTTDEPFNIGTLSPGQSGSYTFEKTGSFAYICEIHPNMSGTIVVAVAADGSISETAATPPSSGE